jgi:hypothetical protein
LFGKRLLQPTATPGNFDFLSTLISKAAAAQVGDLDWNEEKKAVIAHYGGSNNGFSAVALPDQ